MNKQVVMDFGPYIINRYVCIDIYIRRSPLGFNFDGFLFAGKIRDREYTKLQLVDKRRGFEFRSSTSSRSATSTQLFRVYLFLVTCFPFSEVSGLPLHIEQSSKYRI